MAMQVIKYFAAVSGRSSNKEYEQAEATARQLGWEVRKEEVHREEIPPAPSLTFSKHFGTSKIRFSTSVTSPEKEGEVREKFATLLSKMKDEGLHFQGTFSARITITGPELEGRMRQSALTNLAVSLRNDLRGNKHLKGPLPSIEGERDDVSIVFNIKDYDSLDALNGALRKIERKAQEVISSRGTPGAGGPPDKLPWAFFRSNLQACHSRAGGNLFIRLGDW